ncbi:sulfite exporter TauE/SafE family protein [Aeromicrobium camelliae]|uniref:Probable membrane transporter protein n=1 Tax=Aeromicrobium camelliae TaxID=1538144 RepID=A0A3N6YFX7_9ACTN|nr:sulfite exporter TauE/SafE family protein [Aeromicrobium camelliae]RQN08694.1 sulfite exporter TauE/SafE family protein [Aeromicrobium camelliae]
MSEALLLLAGVGAGLCGSIAGLASLVSYPALLAYGLPPFAANVTNTTAMIGTAIGAAAGSRPELRGRGRRAAAVMLQCAIGGALGAALLLARDVIRRRIDAAAQTRGRPRSAPWTGLTVAAGAYGGYFGAGVGIILLSVLGLRDREPLAVTNAIKNVGTGTANAVAVVAYVFAAPVHWWAVLWMGLGALVGAWCGPYVVRVLPERPVRWAIALAGYARAASLLW